LNFSPAFSIYPRIIVIGHFLNSEIDWVMSNILQ
jgi:hypothetical protein